MGSSSSSLDAQNRAAAVVCILWLYDLHGKGSHGDWCLSNSLVLCWERMDNSGCAQQCRSPVSPKEQHAISTTVLHDAKVGLL